MKAPWKGHKWGIEKVRQVFDWCKELNIRIVTFYALSIENIDKRPKKEIDFILNLVKEDVFDMINNPENFIHKNKVRMGFFGRLDMLPEDFQEDIKKLIEVTKDYDQYFMNYAIAYGGRQEIIDTCKKIGLKIARGELKPEDINETVIKQNLYTNGMPDPDLIIRTSERRMSGFLLWQSAYSELAFIDTYWPELTKEQFMAAINDFKERERRLGK